MDGWSRELWFDETDAHWVLPSPNMPTLDSATVFPGIVHLEGTQVSEGRGTTRPFELVGAPYIEAGVFARRLESIGLPGVRFRPTNLRHELTTTCKVRGLLRSSIASSWLSDVHEWLW
jgi:uncharacterized protein YbbC (DUF1343 family)